MSNGPKVVRRGALLEMGFSLRAVRTAEAAGSLRPIRLSPKAHPYYRLDEVERVIGGPVPAAVLARNGRDGR